MVLVCGANEGVVSFVGNSKGDTLITGLEEISVVMFKQLPDDNVTTPN